VTLPTKKPEIFTALNGLRFLAALAVVFFHFAPKVDGYGAVPYFLRKLINEGPAAVGFFFVLSGFVLASRYLQDDKRVESSRKFYWARFTRLYPAYLVGFLLFVPIAAQKYLLHPLSGAPVPQTFALSGFLYCLMLQAWTPLAQAWNGPSWSLSVEAFMYAVFPLIGLRLVRLSLRNTELVLVAAWLVPASIASLYARHLMSALDVAHIRGQQSIAVAASLHHGYLRYQNSSLLEKGELWSRRSCVHHVFAGHLGRGVSLAQLMERGPRRGRRSSATRRTGHLVHQRVGLDRQALRW
jgi:peptidoglycan/LPS O-acetylase OafA/YrhL